MTSVILMGLGSVLMLVGGICGIIVLIGAFRDSVGQGLLCFFIGPYMLYYAFARFEHAKKGLVVGGLLGGSLLGLALFVVAATATANDVAAAPAVDVARAANGVENFAVSNARKSLDKAKQALSAGDASKASMSCAVAEGMISGAQGPDMEGLATEAKELCGFKVPLATAQAEAKKVEASVKTNPDAIMHDGCVGLSMQLDSIKEAGFSAKPEVAPLSALSAEHCN